ncbi:MAG: NUDIX domain-containing protein [Caldilineaceae bacterium]|nr:NUDIX domain-containing protein [Caldilineaceae bacterium]
MAERHYAAAGGVVVDGDRMLVLERPERNEVRLPKGHVEPGEDIAQTAVRETQEESGYADLALVADLGEQTVEFDFAGDHVTRTEHYFLLDLRSQRRIKQPAKDARQFKPVWLTFADAIARLTFVSEQEFARRAAAAQRQRFPGSATSQL